MRLLTKTTLYFLAAMVVLLAGAGMYLFHQFSKELDHQTDEELITDEVQWIRYLKSQADVGATFILRTPEILISPVDEPVTDFPSITQSRGFSARQNKQVPYRQLSHVVSVRGIPYQIIIKKSQEQKTDFVDNIIRLLLIVFAAMFVITLVINWLISQNIWKPFTRSLEKIRGAELQKMKAIHFENTNIKEFNELNESLNYMATKIYEDYINMKEFTENAAHEMQTPLAVVQSKIELLLQDVSLTNVQADTIIQASMALKRLSNLNQSLLLLAKIENQQYETSDLVSLTTISQRYLQQFREIIQDKEIQVYTNYEADFMVLLHPVLADSLVSNLLGNAIKYNVQGGSINIHITAEAYCIGNTSSLPAIDESNLYKRFNKHSSYTGQTSNGLGLSIVKKICDTHQLQINYDYQQQQHTFYIKKATR